MKTKARHIFIFLFLLAALSSTAQSWENEFDFQINYASLPKTNKLAGALNFMADNNGVSVLGLHLDVVYLARLSLTTSPAGIPVLRYKVLLKRITGTTKFHNFNIDTLLVPTRLKASIQVYHKNKLIDSLSQTLRLNQEQILLPVSSPIPLSELYITFHILKIDYTADNYQAFIQTSNKINYYYGYRQEMKDLPVILLKTNDISPDISSLLYNFTALTRLIHHIDQHHFFDSLHLNQKDPLHFRKAYAAAQRKRLRMQTLSEEIMHSGKPVEPGEKEAFAEKYVLLSQKAISLSKQYQPYIAGGFREFARLYPQSPEMNIIRTASRYFEKNNPDGSVSLSHEIYKNFLEAASLYYRQEAYVSALDMLSNAACLEKNFVEIKRTPDFDSLLVLARDGLAASYLKVASLALLHQDNLLANGYLKRAMNSLKYSRQTITEGQTNLCYRQTAKLFNQLAVTALKTQQFRKSLSLLENATKACPENPATDSIRLSVCTQMLQTRWAKTQALLSENQTLQAYDTLLYFARQYPVLCKKGKAVSENPVFRKIASLVFNRLLSDSERHRKDEVTQAMTELHKASLLLKKFSLPASPLLDSLIRETTVPYILVLTQQAGLQIWRKDFKLADSLFRMAQHLSIQYNVDQNREVKQSLAELSAKMKSSGCRWKTEQVQQLLNKTSLAVKNYRLAEAEGYFLQAKKWALQAQHCRENHAKQDSALALYEKLFRFTHQYHQLTLQLFRNGFLSVLPKYAQSDSLFRAWQLKKTGLPYTTLEDYVAQQSLEKTTLAAVRYFIQKRHFQKALKLFILLSNPGKYEKEQRIMAKGFASQQIIPPGKVLNAPVYSAFRKAYRKAQEISGN